MDKKELERMGCRKFVCPNISIIDDRGKELGLRETTIRKAKDMAIEYIKKTYQHPHYISITYLLPSFVHIASIFENDPISNRRIREVFMINEVTMRKWTKDIIDTLNIEIPDSTFKFIDYIEAVRPHIEWIKQQIVASKYGRIMVSLSDFASECGIKMQKTVEGKVIEDSPGIGPKSVELGLKYALFREGIGTKMRTLIDLQPAMVMWIKTKYDKIPRRLMDDISSTLIQTNPEELYEEEPKLSDAGQIEFIKLVDTRMRVVKDSIPYIETAKEAKSFVMGTVSTLTLLAEKLLPQESYNNIQDYINSEMKIINEMIEILKKIE